MTVRSNTYAIRAGASQFASAADGMRQIATRVQQIAATISEKWQGQAENSFHKLAESFQSDIQTASDAFERAYSALDTLAHQLDQANALYQQADQIGSQIQSLEWSHAGADEQGRASISSEIAQLSYRRSSLEYEAQSIEYRANSEAVIVFDDLTSMVNRLHFHHGNQGNTLNNSSVLDKVGYFFNGLWQSAKQEFVKVQNTVEEELQKVNEFASEHPVTGSQIGFTEGFLDSCWEAVKASWGITLMMMGFEPQKEIELAKGIFQAATHPVQTVDNLKDGVKVLFSTVGQSFDDEVVHGNAYTASKWFGYATGVAVQVLATDGEGGAAYAGRMLSTGKKVIHFVKKAVGLTEDSGNESLQVADTLKDNSLTEKTKVESHGQIQQSDVIGDLKVTNIDEIDANVVNDWWKNEMGYENPPYTPKTQVYQFELEENTTFYRVYDLLDDAPPDAKGSRLRGGWLLRKEDIEGLTPEEIRDKYALPQVPKYLGEVELKAGTNIRGGEANSLPDWGRGGGIQFDLVGQRVGSFKYVGELK